MHSLRHCVAWTLISITYILLSRFLFAVRDFGDDIAVGHCAGHSNIAVNCEVIAQGLISWHDAHIAAVLLFTGFLIGHQTRISSVMHEAAMPKAVCDYCRRQLAPSASWYSAVEMNISWAAVTATCTRNCYRDADLIGPNVEREASEQDHCGGDLWQRVVDSDMGERIGEHRINYDHYRVLQEVDGKEQLRIVPKLTAEHVCPDNMRKMSVKLAVQIIQDFMIILDLTERNHVEKGTAMFASQVTMESLRVTLSSILELTNDLLAKGARYVLTGKLNQDPLERFFGITRSFGGDEDHPTILSFSHIYRLLSLYTPVKASIAGNVQEEPTLILATVQETMKQGKKQQLATYEKLRETISAKISEVCLPGISSASHSGPTPLPDHGYALPAVQECVVYYLCGYIVHSFLKHVNCAACISSIQSTNTKFPASLLTLAREFRNGSLKHPSTELYTMLKRVEEKLSLVLGENHLCADMFWDALDVIKDCDVPSVGCSVHKDILTSEIVHSYVVLRMHFFTRDVCKKLSASGRVSSTKKKAKLL
ncbi:hypothetical protein HPB51_019438 [Rhipicephalus microplus]|uniref:Transposable element P transposase-like RNase H C-terminal domain-containing protein n=1 Tax=Rhipicephalus microplus TaxID=6941 RepID=A0A9J6DPS1_RHIMP|nr:hypothetical protein HPB51_019438 [Rhipicephalus microplus]